MIGFLMRKIFFRNIVSPLTEIELIENGISIKLPFGANPKSHYWTEIKSVQFSKNYKEVNIEKSDKQIVLKNDNIGWYEFIQNIPSRYKEYDFNYVTEFMNSLKSCGVCGIIAVRENKCLVCKNLSWNKQMTENEIDYIKLKQSEFYSDLIKEGIKIKKVAEPEHGFKADKNWKLYI